jgi:dihydroorotate dehydrogenase electron transfer subunit
VLYAVLKEGTRLLSRKKPGETVGVLGPLGTPFPHLDRKHPALLVGGGIGVAPLILLAETLSRLKIPHAVFLGARTKKDLLGLDVFRKSGAPLFLATDDGTGGRRGFVTELVEEYLAAGKAPKGSVIHACGPRPMFRVLASVAAKHHLPAYLSWEERMACGMGICLTCACPVSGEGGVRMTRTCVEGPVFEASRIPWDQVED